MILCCGEALIDMLPRRTEDGGDAFQPFAGGAVFNTAIALGRLGTETSVFTGLSSDLFGRILSEKLEEAGVNGNLSVVTDRPTTLAFVTLNNGHASYAFYDENTAGRMLVPEDLPVLPAKPKALFFGGISLAVEPCASAYEALCLREAGTSLIMIDPNIRPGFIADEARYRARLSRMIAAADIIKVSDEDLAWIAKSDATHEAVEFLLGSGPSVVLVTFGSEGAHAYTQSYSVDVPATRVEVVDTVGAGDTFNAGFLAGLDRQNAVAKAGIADIERPVLETAISLGISAAAVTVARAGANPPWANEL